MRYLATHRSVMNQGGGLFVYRTVTRQWSSATHWQPPFRFLCLHCYIGSAHWLGAQGGTAQRTMQGDVNALLLTQVSFPQKSRIWTFHYATTFIFFNLRRAQTRMV